MWLKFSKLGGEVSYDENRHQTDIVSSRTQVLTYWELSLTWTADTAPTATCSGKDAY